ncbi:VQ motif-containing protein [Actinidia chinensis var. chinensis]|uniref:VQ motif-containing protein n=1 Tax=Actinidia chinensis var. chinensis TaxID=1590841 RepID=A0A2R6R668_ACTCC|nr:VQ motif-containing protein [Actinidia chinensis var. chinensis]
MDSCNSGSLQSSSGGEDDYDSRAATESISTFLNPTPQPPPPPPPPPSMFDPLSNFFTPNLETAWSKALTSGPGPGPMAQHLVASSLTALPPVTMSTSTTEQVDRMPHLGPRNPKKRSRASRRAPTTVLTTDPTNFRAMVQEFTGIPTPPFVSSSPFVRSRLDLFGAPGSTRSQPVDASSQPLPYLLRPFAQKFQPPPPIDPIGSSSNSNSNDYQMQNQSLTFQSLLSKSAIPLHEFGFGQTLPSGLPNLVASDGTAWPVGVGPIDGDRGQRQLGLVNGDYGYARSTGTSDKLVNYSASSSDYHSEKGSGNVPSRGEGMVESWICSSDL